MRCVIFAAVSTTAQVGDEANPKESIPAQVADARRLIERRDGWREVHDPLVVDGQSRALDWLDLAVKEIPAFGQLLDLADGGKIDLVIIRDYDRLARTRSLLDQLRVRLRHAKVQIYSLNQPVEPLPPSEAYQESDSAFWMEGILGMVAEYENIVRVRRTQMGLRGRVKRGLHPTNSVPFGYRVNSDRVVLIVPEEAQVVRLIFDLYLAGWGTPSIARELNHRGFHTQRGGPWRQSTVAECVKNPFYAGYTVIGKRRTVSNPNGHRTRRRNPSHEWLIVEGIHEPIISQEVWAAAKREHEKRGHFGPRRQKRLYPLSGLLHCGYCAGAMQIIKTHPQRTYYGCSRHRKFGECQRNSVRLDIIQDRVDILLEELMARPELIEMILEDKDEAESVELEQQKAEVTRRARNLQDTLYRWTRDYEDGLLKRGEFYDHRSRTTERLESVLSQLELVTAKLEAKERMVRSHEHLAQALMEKPDLEVLTPEGQRRFLHSIFSSITVKDSKIASYKFL